MLQLKINKTVVTLGLLLLSFSFFSCQEEVYPKPKAYLHLEYPVATYHQFKNDCPFSFAISTSSKIEFKEGCNAMVNYPKLNATIHITYRRVRNNLKQIMLEVDKLTTKHSVKADAIIPHPFENIKKNTYGLLSDVQGQSASNVQFYVTDSTNHMLTAALYFKVRPNYDSIYPAVAYIKNDMMKMMETITFQ